MPGPPRRPSVPERIARGYAAGAAGKVAYGLLLIALLPVATVLGVLVFGALAVVMYGVIEVVGEPGPPLGTILGVTWFGGSLLIIFLILRRGHRWLGRLAHIAEAPAAWLDPRPDPEDAHPTAPDRGMDRTFHERIAAADAQHAATTGASDDGRKEP